MQAPRPDSPPPAPAGNHIARLYSIINIGTIQEEWEGETKLVNKVRLTWELCNKKKVFKEGEDAKPFSVGADYTFTMGAKGNLRKIVEGMVGKLSDPDANKLDIETLLGTACLLNVGNKIAKNGNEYAFVQGTSPLPEGIEAPAQVNPNFLLGYGETWDKEKFEKLPNFIKDKMMTSLQYKAQDLPTIQVDEATAPEYPTADVDPDDIPF